MPLAMNNLGTAYYFVWASGQIALLILVILLFRRGNHRQYPYFTVYTLSNLGQTGLLLFSFYYWGVRWSKQTVIMGWLAVGLTLAARTFAIAELTRRILASYRGIWRVAWRLIAAGAAGVLVYAAVFSRWSWYSARLKADRGMELALTAVVAILFVFCRYYQVQMSRADRFIGIGFMLYSSMVVISHTLLERFFYQYRSFWNITITLTFFVSTTLWIRALWSPVPKPVSRGAMLPGEFYRALSPEINLRLRALDQQLSTLWKAELRQ